MEYSVSIDKEDIKNSKYLRENFGKVSSSMMNEKMSNLKRGWILSGILIFVIYLSLAIQSKTFLSFSIFIVLLSSAICIYLIILLFLYLPKIVTKRFVGYNYRKLYDYLIGDFNIYFKDDKFIMESKKKTLKINLDGCNVKVSDNNLIIVDKNGFLVLLPIEKFKNFEDFKKYIIQKGGK